jgi:hypothetical protein
MTGPEFEAKVLRLQQQAANVAYERGKELIATGALPVGQGGYIQTLGTYVDGQVRYSLRAFGSAEGMPDSSTTNTFAVNRQLRGNGQIGVPDLRIGANQISDVSLAPKNGTYEQLQRWNFIRPSDIIIVRPEGMLGGGSYVVPRTTIAPLKKP